MGPRLADGGVTGGGGAAGGCCRPERVLGGRGGQPPWRARGERPAWPPPSRTWSGCRVELDHERRAGEERTADLEAIREKLAGEFARLSRDALQQNNSQFLELAESRLKESRQAADGELARRQEAFEQLLKPLGIQLGRYEESDNASRWNARGPTPA